jgi:hypothetical protein
MANTGIFLDATSVRNNARTYLIIHQEARAIEDAILFAADSGLLDAIIYNTYMTSTLLPTFQNITSVNITTNTFTLNNHGFQNGDEVQVNSAGTLPYPLNNASTYYVILVDSNNFRLAAGYMDVVNNNPIDIINAGTGTTQIRAYQPAQQYFDTWKGNRNDRPKVDQMNAVIAYFQSLGYQITRKSNPATGGITFTWNVSW